MFFFKKLDVYGQVALIITGIAFSMTYKNDHFYYAYFMVGGWQILSVIFHLFNKALPILKMRRSYILTTIGVIVFCSIGGFIGLFSLLFISPLLAIWYAYISYRELKNWEARHLIHLK